MKTIFISKQKHFLKRYIKVDKQVVLWGKTFIIKINAIILYFISYIHWVNARLTLNEKENKYRCDTALIKHNSFMIKTKK
jgi:hypothetical protein